MGASAEHGEIVIKVPLCPKDIMRRVEVSDAEDTSHSSPRIVWWASGPSRAVAKSGEFILWSGSGFQQSSPRPAKATIPRHVNVGYLDPSGDGRDDIFDLKEISKAKLRPGQYWTSRGPKNSRPN